MIQSSWIIHLNTIIITISYILKKQVYNVSILNIVPISNKHLNPKKQTNFPLLTFKLTNNFTFRKQLMMINSISFAISVGNLSSKSYIISSFKECLHEKNQIKFKLVNWEFFFEIRIHHADSFFLVSLMRSTDCSCFSQLICTFPVH
jgi:hypothetical protein